MKPTQVLLRKVADSDLPIFFAHQRDAAANRMVAFTVRDPGDREAFMAHWAKILGDEGVIIRTVVYEGAVAGNVASFERDGQREVGYWIGREYWGKGIATAALSQFLVEAKQRPLRASVAGDNLGSIRVLEKCGFTVVGHEKTFAKARGEEIDAVILRLDD